MITIPAAQENTNSARHGRNYEDSFFVGVSTIFKLKKKAIVSKWLFFVLFVACERGIRRVRITKEK